MLVYLLCLCWFVCLSWVVLQVCCFWGFGFMFYLAWVLVCFAALLLFTCLWVLLVGLIGFDWFCVLTLAWLFWVLFVVVAYCCFGWFSLVCSFAVLLTMFVFFGLLICFVWRCLCYWFVLLYVC